MFDGILFDLDGTLWDAVPEIARSWNAVLRRRGVDRPPITPEELTPCMGLLLPDIGERLMPGLPREEMLDILDACCAEEVAWLSVRGAALFPGEEETLAALAAQAPLFVVSNCQDGYIQAFFRGTGLERYFAGFESAGHTGLTKAENISLVAKGYGLKRPVYVGDTALDQSSAQWAGVPFLHAAYGYGTVDGAPAAERFEDIPAVLAEMSLQSGEDSV